jgi:hypothetical protein
MKRSLRCVAFACVLAVGGLYAQDGPPPPPRGPGMGPGGGFGHMGPGPGFGGPQRKVVTGAPYSADVSNQSIETLADGNTIQHTTSGHVARDSQGRTYSQETVTGGRLGQNGPHTFTFINDPVAGYSYALDASSKTAIRRAIKAPPAGAPPQGRGPRGGDSANTVTTDLGTQTIAGVTAQGKNVTHTIPAGTIGNAAPIITTMETWYSPDLQIPVLAKRTDPRMGQSTYSLTNVQRDEPAASLFQVPSDYTVQDAGNGPRAHFRGKPQQ